MLTLIREETRTNISGRKTRYCFCRCTCGGEKWIRRDRFINKEVVSCGCLDHYVKIPDDSRLVIVRSETRFRPNGKPYIKSLCRCSCGTEKWIDKFKVMSGRARSCGCLMKENQQNHPVDHGGYKSRLYKRWLLMRSRCHYQKDASWNDYGGRGIVVCEEWRNSFKAFRDYILPLLPEGTEDIPHELQIGRCNNNGNYEPGNVELQTQSKNMRNTRVNVFITLNGETKTVIEWCEIYKIAISTFGNRIIRGWDAEKALTTPPKKRTKRAA